MLNSGNEDDGGGGGGKVGESGIDWEREREGKHEGGKNKEIHIYVVWHLLCGLTINSD